MPGPGRGFIKRLTGSEKGRTAFEAIVVAILLMFLLFIAVDRYYKSVASVRETALTVELSNLRSAIHYYVALKGRLPESLPGLIKTGASAGRKEISGQDYRVLIIGAYVESMTLDKEGFPLDPFGNRYAYDPSTGMLRSGTEGYGKW